LSVLLLDANVLIALAWPAHEAHSRVGAWFGKHSSDGWATCPLTQCALVRILSNPAFSSDALSVENALAVLEANLNLPGHEFWSADIPLLQVRKQVGKISGHAQITDAYLIGLAVHRRGKVATLDREVAALAPAGAVELIG
jgi:uncharacterized protein